MRRSWRIVLGLVAVMVVDNRAAWWADKRILMRHADFKERYVHADLVWVNPPYEQLSEIRTEMLFYKYRTLFRWGSGTPGGEYSSLHYKYVAPRGLLSLTRLLDWRDDVYLRSGPPMPISRKTIAFVYRDKGWKFDYKDKEMVWHRQNRNF